MLEEFTVDNYKSLINVTFRPKTLNLILGLNNAGKTNLCQALRFVGASAGLPLEQCADYIAGGRIGMTNFYFDKPTLDFHVKACVPFEGENLKFEYHLTVKAPTQPTPTPIIEAENEKLIVTGKNFNSVALLENTRNGVKLWHEQKSEYVETTAPRDVTMLNRLYDLKTNARANCFKRYLQSWQYYEFSTSSLRVPTHKPNEIILAPDGSNLSSVICHLKTSNERYYRRLLEYVRKLDPSIDVINFQVAAENSVFMFLEDKNGNQFPSWNASSGTLRFLGLTYALLIQPFLIKPLKPLIIVEEPENGVYVGFLRDIINMASPSDGGTQIIFTSHSPYFVDLFDSHIESIFSMKRGEHHSSITQPDVEQVKTRLKDFPLGEQHFREMLG